jgi:hypothetical protein
MPVLILNLRGGGRDGDKAKIIQGPHVLGAHKTSELRGCSFSSSSPVWKKSIDGAPEALRKSVRHVFLTETFCPPQSRGESIAEQAVSLPGPSLAETSP